MTSTALINNRPKLENTEQLQQMAKALSASAMCPAQYKGKPTDAFVAIIAGAEVGFQPMQSLKSIAVINGRPTIYGDGLPAIAYGSGQLEMYEEIYEGEGDTLTAIVRLERKGVRGVREFRFSVADAKRANLWGKKGPWSDYPTRMLVMRARSYAFRDVFADYLAGLHIAEEQRDIEFSEVSQEAPRISFDADEPEQTGPTEEVVDAEAEPVGNEPDWATLICDCKTVDELDQFVSSEMKPTLKAGIQPYLEIIAERRQALLEKAGEKF